jgi:Ca2+-transporting ATPase
VNRSEYRTIVETLRSPNRALWWVAGSALVLLALVLCLPGLRALFLMAPLHASDIAICVLAGMLSIAWLEFVKVLSKAEPKAYT